MCASGFGKSAESGPFRCAAALSPDGFAGGSEENVCRIASSPGALAGAQSPQSIFFSGLGQ